MGSLVYSLGQLNIERNLPNDFMGLKMPNDFLKIGVKEALGYLKVFVTELGIYRCYHSWNVLRNSVTMLYIVMYQQIAWGGIT